MILGIDLGTTFSVGAYMEDNGEIHIIDNTEGSALTPSVVLFDEENEIIVGDVAKENAVLRPEDVIAVVKNYMGKDVVLKERDGKSYTPEMISSFILRKVVQDAQNFTGEKVEGVVVTVPAYFTDAQRKATGDAVVMAGVPLVGMINEPTAAALSYVKNHNIQNENIMIYDLGGGTFDVTILKIHSFENIEVLSTGGLSNAGGHFFDQFIVDYVNDYMKEHHDIDLEDEEYTDELQDLYIKAENAKIHLSQKVKVTIPLKVGKVKESIELTRDQFESMIARVYMRTESKCKDALKEAKLTVGDISKVLMVGGSSRIPYVTEHIAQFTGKEPCKEINPDEAVAMGAAIYAKVGNTKTKFTDVCSHSIGVVVVNEYGQEENEIIIRRNSQIPVQQEEYFRTMVENQQKLELAVTEGEFKELTDVTIIGRFEIELPDGLPEKSRIVIRIWLDHYQLIHITVALPDVGFEKEYHMKRIANLDDETVQNVTGMLRDYKIS